MAKLTLNGVDALTESGGTVTIPAATNLNLGTGAVPTAAIQDDAVTSAKLDTNIAVAVPRLFAVPDRVAFSANVVVPVAPTVIAGEASDPCRTKLSALDFIIKFAISYPLFIYG